MLPPQHFLGQTLRKPAGPGTSGTRYFWDPVLLGPDTSGFHCRFLASSKQWPVKILVRSRLNIPFSSRTITRNGSQSGNLRQPRVAFFPGWQAISTCNSDETLNPETLFTICNNAAAIGWIILILTPRFPIIARVFIPIFLCGSLALVYLYLVVTDFGDAEGDFLSYSGIMKLFSNPQVVLAGWIHYLAFDLFIGCWEVRDSRRLGIHHLLIVPPLILTFLLGPVGLLCYLMIRFFRARKIQLGLPSTSDTPPQASNVS